MKMKKSIDQRKHLDSQSRANQIEGHCGESVLFQERHQEPKANKDHHVDVLKNCKIYLVKFGLTNNIAALTWINIFNLFVTVDDTVLASLSVGRVIS